MWKQRMNKKDGAEEGAGGSTDSDDPLELNGKPINLAYTVKLEDMIFSPYNTQSIEVSYSKQSNCVKCHGTRESNGGQGFTCYGCKGSGIREDPLFRRKQKCNTCKGFGTMVKDPCKSCNA